MKQRVLGVERVLVQLPRGRSAVVQFNPRTSRVITDHAGLRASYFEKGVRGIDGRLFHPADGRLFLVALFDRLFLSGYTVRWLWPLKCAGMTKNHVE